MGWGGMGAQNPYTAIIPAKASTPSTPASVGRVTTSAAAAAASGERGRPSGDQREGEEQARPAPTTRLGPQRRRGLEQEVDPVGEEESRGGEDGSAHGLPRQRADQRRGGDKLQRAIAGPSQRAAPGTDPGSPRNGSASADSPK